MHATAYKLMTNELRKLKTPRGTVLDVGSLDVNGTYRPLITDRHLKYIGLDIRKGKNVNVLSQPFNYPFRTNTFDAVISGSTMEHVTAIWLWVPELTRILKPGGLLIIATIWTGGIHRYPCDCWRILPDGIKYLFDLTHQLQHYAIATHNHWDIIASATKTTTP